MKKHIVLGISDHGSTGINESIRYPLTHFHNSGHEVWQLGLGYNGVVAGVDKNFCPWRERLMPILPTSEMTKFGQNQIREALALSKANVVMTSFDLWMVNYLLQPENCPQLDEATKKVLSHQNRKFSHICYFPIDGSIQNKYLPIGFDESICGADVPVTYSNYARDLIQNNTNITIPMIPIPHDPKIFYPRDKKECRRQLKLDENSFIVGMVGANQYRKSFSHFFDAVIPFAQQHKDIQILPYTTWNQQIMGGCEIKDFVFRSGIADRIIDPSSFVQRLSDEGMSILYNALDVLVLATVGEGAGLPPLRARACGVPALVTENTSNTEFFGHPFEGIKCKAKYYDNFGSNLERYITDSDDLREKLEILYNNPELLSEIGAAGLAHMSQFEVDKIMPMWDEILESIPVREDEVAK